MLLAENVRAARNIAPTLDGKVAIVTGASRGIGREIAVEFARQGAAVVLAARNAAQLDEVIAPLDSDGLRVLAVATDVTDRAAVQSLADKTFATFGKVDVLVNNAGENYIASLMLSDDERWRQIFETNVFAVYYCTKAVLPSMIRAKWGRIINIASTAGVVGAAHNSAYSAAKAAAIGFTKSVALEVARLGITCNAICPWHVDTAMMHGAMAARGAMFGRQEQDYLAGIVATNPQQRLISPQEIAAFAVFLSSEAAGGITGQTLNQCGGFVTS